MVHDDHIALNFGHCIGFLKYDFLKVVFKVHSLIREDGVGFLLGYLMMIQKVSSKVFLIHFT